MTKRILFFTAGAALTEQEKATIEALNALTEPAYQVTVHNGDIDPDFVVPGDFAVGSIPTTYGSLPVFDPANPPTPPIGDDKAIVSNGQALSVSLNGTAQQITPTVAAGALTALQTPVTAAVVANAGTAPVQNSAGAAVGTGTITVANRAVSNIRLAATIAGVANTAAVAVLPASGSASLASATAAVAAGALTGARLPATTGIVTNGQTLAVTGGTVTITVAANAVTAVFTAE